MNNKRTDDGEKRDLLRQTCVHVVAGEENQGIGIEKKKKKFP